MTHLVPLKAIALLERNLTDDGELVRVGLRPNDAQFQTERAMIYTHARAGPLPAVPRHHLEDAEGLDGEDPAAGGGILLAACGRRRS